ncbi:hypothetical protein CerSpe_098410 [Prunus speciosa]
MSERRRAGPGRLERGRPTTEELVEHLEESLGISNLEEGPKLVGAVIAQKLPNKGAIKNILKAAWKNYGETKIAWVRDNLFAITVTDEGMANKILENGPWSVMKCCFAVKRWPPAKAIEEVDMDLVPHWVQIRGIPLNLSHEENMIKLGEKAGAVMEYENPAKLRGFLRVRVEVDTNQPLVAGFWLPRPDGSETWVEYQYERLADFCYRCGRIGHCMDACNFEVSPEIDAKYGEWTRARIIRELVDPKPPTKTPWERRRAATVRRRPGSDGAARESHDQIGQGEVTLENHNAQSDQTASATGQLGTDGSSHDVELSHAGETDLEERYEDLLGTRQMEPLYLTQGNQSPRQICGGVENPMNAVILFPNDLNTAANTSGTRFSPNSTERSLEWAHTHMTKEKPSVTYWCKHRPNHGEDTLDPGLFGHSIQVEPQFKNPFGPAITVPPTRVVSQVSTMLHTLGLKRHNEYGRGPHVGSPGKKQKSTHRKGDTEEGGQNQKESAADVKSKRRLYKPRKTNHGDSSTTKGTTRRSQVTFEEENLTEVNIIQAEQWEQGGKRVSSNEEGASTQGGGGWPTTAAGEP